jgi:hypothetical protein
MSTLRRALPLVRSASPLLAMPSRTLVEDCAVKSPPSFRLTPRSPAGSGSTLPETSMLALPVSEFDFARLTIMFPSSAGESVP